MNTQNRIKRTLSQTANTEYVSRLLGSKAFFSRNELADAVCEHFGFYDTRGLRQRSGCVKALRELEAAGQFVLPAMRSKNGGRHSPRRADEAIAAPRELSVTRQPMGTPPYMSPEQTRSAKDVGPQADVWSLGVTLYHLLTRSLPWPDPDLAELTMKIRHAAAPDIKSRCAGISAGACRIVEKALQKHPRERYPDCREMAEALRSHLDSIGSSGVSVLPDDGAGATKVMLVGMPPPTRNTLTMIGSSLFAAGRRISERPTARTMPDTTPFVPETKPATAPASAGAPASSPPATPALAASSPATRAQRNVAAPLVIAGLLLAILVAGGATIGWYFGIHLPTERARVAREKLLADEAAKRAEAEEARREAERLAQEKIERERRARLASEVEKRREFERLATLLAAARSLSSAGLLDKAREKAAEALAAAPNNAEARSLLAALQTRMDEVFETAMAEGRELEEREDLDGAFGSYRRASQGAIDEASLRRAEQAAERVKARGEYLAARDAGDAAVARKDYARAVAEFQKAEKTAPTAEIAARLADGRARAAEAAGDSAVEASDWELAAAKYEEAKSIRPSPQLSEKLVSVRQSLAHAKHMADLEAALPKDFDGFLRHFKREKDLNVRIDILTLGLRLYGDTRHRKTVEQMLRKEQAARTAALFKIVDAHADKLSTSRQREEYLESQLPRFKGTQYEKTVAKMLKTERAKIIAAQKRAREEAARKVYELVMAEIKKTPDDHLGNRDRLIEARAGVEGSRFEPYLEREIVRQRRMLGER